MSSDAWVTEVVREGYAIPFLSTPPLSSHPVTPVHQGESPGPGDRGTGGEGSNRTRSLTFGGFLQSPVRGEESIWSLETGHRPLSPEQVRPQIKVQDGDGGDCSLLHSVKRLVFDLRFERRLLADSYTALHSSPSLHQGDGSSFGHSPPKVHQNRLLLGRLATYGRLPRGVTSGKGGGVRHMRKPRHCHQSRQISPRAKETTIYLGMEIDLTRFRASPSSKRRTLFLSLVEEFMSCNEHPAQSWRVLLGHMASLLHLIPAARLRMRALQWCLRRQWNFEDESKIVCLNEEARRDLVGGRSSQSRKISESSVARPVPVFRCFGSGLGGDDGQQLRLGSLESGGDAAFHQCQGTSCCGERAIRSPGISEGSHSRSDGGGLSEMSGGIGLSSPQYHLSEDPEVLRVRGYFASSPVSSGFQQRGGRCSLQTGFSSGSRVDVPQGGVSGAAAPVACECRSIRYFSQSPVLSLFCTLPRPTSCRSGCDGPQLGQPGLLRFSTLRDDPGCPEQAANILELSHDSDRAHVETETVVSRSSRLVSRGSNTSPSETRPSSSATRKEIPLKSPSARPSCVATMRRFAKHVGIPSRVADKISKSRSRSPIHSLEPSVCGL